MIKYIAVLKYGGNMYIILVYDIKQVGDFQKVQRKVFKECKKYLYHVQNSVFEGEISKSQLFCLEAALSSFFRKEIDSCIVFKSNNKKWLNKIYITAEIDDNHQFI